MDKLFHLDIVSSEKVIYNADVVSLVVPAEFGYMGILAGHAPLVARLTKGRITAVQKDLVGPKVFELGSGGGFVEVLKDKVSVII